MRLWAPKHFSGYLPPNLWAFVSADGALQRRVMKVLNARTSGGEALLLDPGVVRPLTDRNWQAELLRLSAVDTSVDLVTLDPHTYDSRASRVRFQPALLLVAVDTGRMQGSAGDQQFEVLPGQALLLDTRQPIFARVDHPVRLLRVVVSQRRLPHRFFQRDPSPATVLTDSPIMRASLAAARTLLARSQDDDTHDDAAIAHLITGMQLGMLTESLRQHALEEGFESPRTRREQIDRYITAHLSDPELSPGSIATVFGISLRSVHAAYTGTNTTVGSTIRRNRIEHVKHQLGHGFPISLHDLAVEAGFRDTTHLARVFRATTGITVREWVDRNRHSR